MSSPNGRKLAILIGINGYGNDIPPLRNAVEDANYIANILHSAHGYEVELLTKDQPTLGGLRTRLAALRTELSEQDCLILYFAGHGIAEELREGSGGPQGFFVPLDARLNEPTSYLPMDEVQKTLEGVPCRHMLLLLDCCFAGAFRWKSSSPSPQTRNLRKDPPKLYLETYERYLRNPAWQVITSAAEDETALDAVGSSFGKRGEGPHKNSPFAEALGKALQGSADLRMDKQPGDGVMLATEIYLYVETAMSNLEAGRKSRQPMATVQTPMLWWIKGQHKGQFIFYTPGGKFDVRPGPELNEANRPYRGLEPYEQIHAELFFGRNELTDELLQQVIKQPLTVVSGRSGVGKSSLVNAGLRSRLQQEVPAWRLLPTLRPGKQPMAALVALAAELQLPTGPTLDFASAVAAFCRQQPACPVLLVIDPLEELLTKGASAEERERFLTAIEQCLAATTGRLHAVMVLRSDCEPQFQQFLASQAGAGVPFRVPSPSPDQLREVIEGPAEKRGLDFEPPSLVDRLLAEVANMPSPLPLLSFRLNQLYQAYVKADRKKDRMLTRAEYDSIGSVAKLLSANADEIVQALDEPHRATLRRILLRMVSLESTERSRRRVPLAELHYGQSEEEQRVKFVLNKLAEQKLLIVFDSGPPDPPAPAPPDPDPPSVVLAHDKLLREWPKLTEFITSTEKTLPLPLQHQLRKAALDWQHNKGQRQYLWHDSYILPQAVAMLKGDAQSFNALEKTFIAKSKARRQRWIALITSSIVGVIVLLSVITAKALIERAAARRARDQAEQRELALIVENGRQLLVDQNRSADALLWLQKAYERGARTPELAELLAAAVRPLEAMRFSLRGHTGEVYSASYSPDGRRIVTVSRDGTARLWDAESGEHRLTLREPGVPFINVSFSADGRQLIATHTDRKVRLWDTESGKSLHALGGQVLDVSSATYSADGRLIVAVSRDNSALILDAKTGAKLAEARGHKGPVTSASFHPEGHQILTSSEDRTARLWDTVSGKLLVTFYGHDAPLWTAASSPDGQRIVTASDDQTARIWDAQSGHTLLILAGHTGRVWYASYSPDGLRVATASEDKTARIWDARTGKLLLILGGQADDVRSVNYSPDGRHVVLASDDRTARVWVADWGPSLNSLSGHRTAVVSATYHPNGRYIVTTSGDRSVRVWDADSGKPLPGLEGHTAGVRSATYSPSGRNIVTASWDKTARVWDAESGKTLQILNQHTGPVLSAGYSPDGRYIVTASQDGTARVWDADSDKSLAVLRDSDAGKAEVYDAQFSGDGRRIVTASWDHKVRIWDAKSYKLLRELKHAGPVWSARYSPDGSRIVTACEDQSAWIWNALTGERLYGLQGHANRVVSASYSPDGRYIVTTSWDNTARIWDAESGKVVGVLQEHSSYVFGASYSPDGRRLVTASNDKTARIWDVAPTTRSADELRRLIRCHLGYSLEGDEAFTVQVERASCQNLPMREPPPLSWDERSLPLWRGIYAFHAGRLVAARPAWAEARLRFEHFQDLEGLAKLALAEAAADAPEDAPLPAAVPTLVQRLPEAVRVDVWNRLANFAQDSLYRPRWTLALHAQLVGVKSPGILAMVRANELEARLAMGQTAEVIRMGAQVYAEQPTDQYKVVVAAFVWLAALHQGLLNEQQVWAQRVLSTYAALTDDSLIGWTLPGTRRALLLRPENSARATALELCYLLEQRKTADTVKQLAKLLSLSPPCL